ncbi:MAG: hypothetical protein AAGF23_23160, partial [Acidobacteriota bacterium]
LVATAAWAPGALAQDWDDEEALVEDDKGHVVGFEVKTHYRDSEDQRFPSPFPFGPASLPVGQERGFLETVEAGEHFELSAATVFYRGEWGKHWGAKAKIDLYDLHDRNPTSDDNEWDVDELWLRYGPEIEPGETHEGYSAYVKLGKFPKFERQDDRHLESYGLISTSFNRAEDVGVEAGFDLGRYFYLKASITQGNPVFYRDPNALAGDHGTRILDGSVPNPEPELQTGFPILYDADVELDNLDFDNPEGGIGLGVRFGGDTWNLDVLAFRYERDLADTVELEGTIYGGDLDILQGPGNRFPLAPLTSREKEEIGVTAWFYMSGLTLFAQYVDQDLGGLERDGFEVEVSYDFELPYIGSLWGRQVLHYLAPAIRYSEIDPQFTADPFFPAPSVFWDWDKIDIGLRVGLVQGIADMTLEYNDNTFVRAGRDESADEFLATFRFMWDWRLETETW